MIKDKYYVFALNINPTSSYLIQSYSDCIEGFQSLRNIAVQIFGIYGSEAQVLFIREDQLESILYYTNSHGRINVVRYPYVVNLFDWIIKGDSSL